MIASYEKTCQGMIRKSGGVAVIGAVGAVSAAIGAVVAVTGTVIAMLLLFVFDLRIIAVTGAVVVAAINAAGGAGGGDVVAAIGVATGADGATTIAVLAVVKALVRLLV